MAGTVNYLYDPNQSIYVIHECENNLFVVGGTVFRVRAEVLASGTTVYYDVRLKSISGTFEFKEEDVFADKTTAVAEYETRIT